MKNIALGFTLLCSFFLVQAQGHKITFNIKNMEDSIVYLARYYGDNKYIKDTIVTNRKGKFELVGKAPLPCGIYLIVRQDRGSYMEFLVHEQEFTVNSDATDFIQKTKFKGSLYNTQLYEYFSFSTALNKKRMELSKEIDQIAKENKALTQAKQKELQELGAEMEAYTDDFLVKYPQNPMSVVFKMQKEVIIPEDLRQDDSEEGKMKQYKYYLNHYWDNVDLQSPCLIRTPLFHGKLQRFCDQVIPQHFDSVFKYIQPLVEKARGNDEVFKYIVNYTTFKWESGKDKRMCWDKVFYQMAKTYYVSGQVDWVDDTKMAKIKSRVEDLQYALCGEPAVNLIMRGQTKPGLYDTTGTLHDMYAVDADYVLLWFWDSDCGHCKKQTPKLHKAYQKYKALGKSVAVYSINIETDSKGYKKYLRENKYDWINVQDTMHLSGFRRYYDIYSTPVVYVLDKDRKIVAKRIDPEGVEKFLDVQFNILKEEAITNLKEEE